MSKFAIALGGWLALNAALSALLLARRSRPRLQQHRLFQWVIGNRGRTRHRQFAHDLIVAHRHHR
jgi:hypothetical protein